MGEIPAVSLGSQGALENNIDLEVCECLCCVLAIQSITQAHKWTHWCDGRLTCRSGGFVLCTDHGYSSESLLCHHEVPEMSVFALHQFRVTLLIFARNILFVFNWKFKSHWNVAFYILVCEDTTPYVNFHKYEPIFLTCINREKVSNLFTCNGFYRPNLPKPHHMNKYTCRPLLFTNHYGQCESYKTRKVPKLTESTKEMEIYQCANSSIIDQREVDDLIPDCFKADDELIVFILLSEWFDNFCQSCDNNNDIPCMTGHPLCYKIIDICVFMLSDLGHIVPCRTGSHIEECKYVKCNAKFKCPNYYCIPYSYVCDG